MAYYSDGDNDNDSEFKSTIRKAWEAKKATAYVRRAKVVALLQDKVRATRDSRRKLEEQEDDHDHRLALLQLGNNGNKDSLNVGNVSDHSSGIPPNIFERRNGVFIFTGPVTFGHNNNNNGAFNVGNTAVDHVKPSLQLAAAASAPAGI